MKRVRIAAAILLAAVSLAVASHFAVYRITCTVQEQLAAIRAQANMQNHTAAAEKIDELLLYYESRQHLLELFIKRETVTNTAVNLHGLSAYATEETTHDLCSEIDKAREQVHAMEHLFFSIF